jgi:hypothetical protein
MRKMRAFAQRSRARALLDGAGAGIAARLDAHDAERPPPNVPSLERVSTFAEVFDPADPVARFVVAMCIARNDVRHALTQAGRATDDDAPEYAYWIRMAASHYFEADDALREWRQVPEVRAFIRTVPDDGREALRVAASASQKMGKGVLEHLRQRTFHYPSPANRYDLDRELEKALCALGGEEVTAVVEADGFFRWRFADDVALTLSLAKHDRKRLREQSLLMRDGAIGFVNFATRAWEAYAEKHGLEMGPPEPPVEP